jgi:hypothetical protein
LGTKVIEEEEWKLVNVHSHNLIFRWKDETKRLCLFWSLTYFGHLSFLMF